jgi:hypothetical protein
MGSKFCGEIVSEGFRSHEKLKRLKGVEVVEEVEGVEGVELASRRLRS